MRRHDRGQAGVLMLIVAAVLFAALSAAMVTLGDQMIDRTRARTAADAAALAGLDGGPAAARALAERHGAVLVSFTRHPGERTVTVVVRMGAATAGAAATDVP